MLRALLNNALYLFADVLDGQLLGRHGLLLLEGLGVVLGEVEHLLDGFLVDAAVGVVVLQRQAVHPALLVQVQQHL